MAFFKRFFHAGLLLFVFFLPLQTRWIYYEAIIKDAVWEYGRKSLYGTEIILIALIVLGIILKFVCHPEAAALLRRPRNPIMYAIIAVIAYAGLSIIWSQEKAIAAQAVLRIIEGVGLLWLVYENKHLIGKLKIALIASGLAQGFLAIYQFFTQSTFASKWFGIALISTKDLGTSVVEFLDQRWLRAYGSFPHPNILGGFLAIVLIIIIISLWKLNTEVADNGCASRKQLYLNIFYWFSACVIFLGLIFSFSRSAWIGAAAGFAFLFIYAFKKRLVLERWVMIKLGIVFVCLVGFILIGFPHQLFTARITAAGRLEQRSLIERKNSENDAKEIIKAHPLFGVGLGNYTKAIQEKYQNMPGWFYQPAHNWYLLVLTELGLVGFLLLIFLLVSLLRKVKGIAWALILPLLIISFFDHYFWTLYFGVMLWWLVWGLANNSKIPPYSVQGIK